MSVYDTVAPNFDRLRGVPDGVAAAIRRAVLGAIRCAEPPLMLDLGAGSGRIGAAFAAAGDRYIGVDRSFGMLRVFAARHDLPCTHAVLLAQADGERLPFRDATFDAVLLMQVLNSANDWRLLAAEARRVVAPTGALIVGRTVAPEDGIDARMKLRLAGLLDAMGVEARRKQPSDAATRWLERNGHETCIATAAAWTAHRTPRGFLERHATGARFSVLPPSIKEVAMSRLRDWTVATFGSLDAVCVEAFRYDLMICRLHPGMPH
jgi:ubiquinone/menaquinone biosynthesis C-methylase UbiE